MLFSVEQAFVGRDEKRAPLKTPAWEANMVLAWLISDMSLIKFYFLHVPLAQPLVKPNKVVRDKVQDNNNRGVVIIVPQICLL